MPEVPPDELADDEDELDSGSVDFKVDPVSDDELAGVILSPEGDPAKLAAYKELFPDG